MTPAELEAELIRLRTLTGNFRHTYNGGLKWWQDPEYLDLKRQIEAIKQQINGLTTN